MNRIHNAYTQASARLPEVKVDFYLWVLSEARRILKQVQVIDRNRNENAKAVLEDMKVNPDHLKEGER